MCNGHSGGGCPPTSPPANNTTHTFIHAHTHTHTHAHTHTFIHMHTRATITHRLPAGGTRPRYGAVPGGTLCPEPVDLQRVTSLGQKQPSAAAVVEVNATRRVGVTETEQASHDGVCWRVRLRSSGDVAAKEQPHYVLLTGLFPCLPEWATQEQPHHFICSSDVDAHPASLSRHEEDEYGWPVVKVVNEWLTPLSWCRAVKAHIVKATALHKRLCGMWQWLVLSQHVVRWVGGRYALLPREPPLSLIQI